MEIGYIAYWSEGLRITGMVVKPEGQGKWPLVLVNHGGGSFSKDHMIQVQTVASAGFVAFASDYRGQGESEGRMAAAGNGSLLMAHDVVNGAQNVKGFPYVDGTRIGLWGHSMGGGVGWNLLTTEFGKQIKAYAQISSGPAITEEQLREIHCPVWLVAGGAEPAALERLPLTAERLMKAGVPYEIKAFPGYSHHSMKFEESLQGAIAFLKRNVTAK